MATFANTLEANVRKYPQIFHLNHFLIILFYVYIYPLYLLPSYSRRQHWTEIKSTFWWFPPLLSRFPRASNFPFLSFFLFVFFVLCFQRVTSGIQKFSKNGKSYSNLQEVLPFVWIAKCRATQQSILDFTLRNFRAWAHLKNAMFST